MLSQSSLDLRLVRRGQCKGCPYRDLGEMVEALLDASQSLVRGENFDCKCIVAAIVQLGVKRCIVFDMCIYDTVADVVEVYGNRRQQCFAALSPSCSAVPFEMDAN